ncbi:hypothetical protein WOLCODRAFT_23171 [Wolfiporia cocos MD-104 SS10]|uniref:AIG1-type G domain-containing protein n=1 Tax=Wolfiporia cocos (strain MD-104) TaxID=742152 RepID=A0A2H3J9C8_WOLCO|nr:hypothetical protein WOLCODRAFT_23171 [Wolfiporia cocos MD-104 SS10]
MATPVVVVVGSSGTGKTEFTNLVAGSGFEVGCSLEPCTQEVQVAQANLDGRSFELIDTPGFDPEEPGITRKIARYLKSISKESKEVVGVILMHRIALDRFNKDTSESFEAFKKLCGQQAMKNAAIVTTMWNEVDASVGADREAQLQSNFYKEVIREGAQLQRYQDRTAETAKQIVRQLLQNPGVRLQCQGQA